MAKLLLLHGPNLNLLGGREPAVYGHDTLAEINARADAQVAAAGHQLQCRQSNAEHQLIDWVQAAPGEGVAFIVINPGGYTHTSVALRDALAAVALPFIEVHLSNVAAREPFRRHSYFSDLALGTITGLGAIGYELALTAALRHLGARP
ncbi:type II 3-dehydroquinate dehydratase [Immundisolibacter sp.]|jgi:3-dehydroquinate dehydratase II|uniref:type II 3-dehydroquinate dehydratase n=1 Tax=Immundisolibacter sp. TaxID=1934948 RepID=UPI000ED9A7C7|nr:type II 3-dehydroquinate dehydratase [Gammaproteobacteria bacterium]